MQVSAATASIPTQSTAPLQSAAAKPEKPVQKLADLILADAVRGNQIDLHA